MKTYDQLTQDQQKAAVRHAVSDLLEAIVSGEIRFNDELNRDRLQQRIDKACKKAEDMRTPWFAHEYVMEDSYCRERIEDMAQCDAEDAVYSEPGERVIRGIVTEQSRAPSV